ncbi:MAG: right-handed parallel beta-helix repeat-containing protein [Limnochordia bacterium]|jgi:hypothetical protein
MSSRYRITGDAAVTLSILLAMWFAVLGFVAGVEAGEGLVIPNSCFDEVDEHGWPVAWSNTRRGEPFYQLGVDKDAFEGQPAARLSGNDNPAGGLVLLVMKNIPAVEFRNRTMKLSAWYKGSVTKEFEASQSFIRVEFYKTPPGGGNVRAGSSHTFRVPGRTDGWVLLEKEFTVYPETEKIWISVGFYNADGYTQWAEIDVRDVSAVSSSPGAAEREPGTFYVSPTGDDAAAGTIDAPWGSLAHASSTAIPGDTIRFLPGEYEGVLRPIRGGTSEAPIVFQSWPRRSAVLLGQSYSDHAVNLSRVEYVHVEGFTIRPRSDQGRWLLVENSHHIEIDDVLMEDAASGGMPMHINASHHVFVRDSVMRGGGFNMARVGHSSHILFAGNAISRAGHCPLQFYPDGSTSHVVLRGNVFHAAWGRNFEFFGTKHVLFENNIVTNALHSSRSASASAKFATQDGIFRFNRVFRNWGGPLHDYPMRDQWITNLRVYNNVFDNNYDFGMAISDSHSSMLEASQMRNVVLANNVFYRNDTPGNSLQVRFRSMDGPEADASGEMVPIVRFVNNLVAARDEHCKELIDVNGSRFSVDAVQNPAWQSISHGATYFAGNIDTPPAFVDADNYNHAPAPGSPLLDGGAFLTMAVGTGQGLEIPVKDASFFYDGFGIEGELGDLIAIGSADQVARVVKVDRARQTLTVDREVTWTEGDGLSLAWSGNAPDMGVYELGERGRPAVQIVTDSLLVQPGEAVRLSVKLYGISDAAEIRWQLGDGSIAYGHEVIHRYDKPYDYPLRVRVTTGAGEIVRGTGYVVVEAPRAATDPFLHSTFSHADYDADDENWMWYWKMNWGEIPIDWSHEVDPLTGKGRLRVSNPGGGTMPLRIAPPEWDVLEYPWIYLRYRIAPGTPLGLYIEAFQGSDGRTRKKWLAVTAGERKIEADQVVLVDDGEWHTLLVDARLILRDDPSITILQRLGLEASSGSTQGDTYWIEEAAILPQAAALSAEWQQKLRDRERGHVDVTSPRPGATVCGEVAVDFEVQRYLQVDGNTMFGDVKQVSVEIDGVEVLTADNVKAAGLRIDTNSWPDGYYRLAVKLTDEQGHTVRGISRLAIRNWQTFVDRMDSPRHVMMFGEMVTFDFSRTVDRSEGWVYADEDMDPLFSDDGRLIKSSAEPEYLTWSAPDLKTFKITVYVRDRDVRESVTLAAGMKGGHWVELPYDVQKVASAARGWTKCELSGAGPEGGEAEEFRLTVDRHAPGGDLQVGEVELEMRSG